MTSPAEREAILYAFAAEENHDRATLESYLRKYPDLTQDLIELSSEFRFSQVVDSKLENVASPERNWNSAWKRFQASIPKQTTTATIVNPFATFRGPAFVQLAQSLNVSRSFLTAFRDGLVIASSIPESFAIRFAKATDQTLDATLAFFSNTPTELVARQFSADVRPSHQGQKTFKDFVQSSDLTDEQRKLLLEDLNDDGLDRSKSAKS